MERFEYEVTTHAPEIITEAAFACTEEGECAIPAGQTAQLLSILNERGLQGWELVQLFINKTGATVFWKRKIIKKEA